MEAHYNNGLFFVYPDETNGLPFKEFKELITKRVQQNILDENLNPKLCYFCKKNKISDVCIFQKNQVITLFAPCNSCLGDMLAQFSTHILEKHKMLEFDYHNPGQFYHA